MIWEKVNKVPARYLYFVPSLKQIQSINVKQIRESM